MRFSPVSRGIAEGIPSAAQLEEGNGCGTAASATPVASSEYFEAVEGPRTSIGAPDAVFETEGTMPTSLTRHRADVDAF